MHEFTFYVLDFHRRADKPAWWALFKRMEMSHGELLDDPECLGDLREPGLAYRELSRTDIREIRRICASHGWVREAAALEVSIHGFEQEALPALLPP